MRISGIVYFLAVITSALYLSLPHSGRTDPGTPAYSSLTTIDGLTVVELAGSARDIGYGHGKLLGGRFFETEDAFKKIMPPIPLGWFGEMLLHWYVMGKVEDIEPYLTDTELDELKGLDDSSPDPDRDYRDVLYYHILQDIGQNYACTGGAVLGNRSKTGGPIAGRNFDMNRDGALDSLKTVFHIRPEVGADYVSVAWPGMVGAVSGMNEHGLAVMEFSAKSEGSELDGVPVTFILKRVLLNARNVDEAVEIIRSTKRMGPNIFLVADRERAVAVEFDSGHVSMCEAEDDLLAVSNHFISPPLNTDEKNLSYIKESDTVQRFHRMRSLLHYKTAIGAGDMALVLCDHRGLAGDELAPEDPSAINNTKCAHSVIFDTGSLTVWVAKGPMAYGGYVGLRMSQAGLIPVDTIPAREYSHATGATR